MSLRYEGRVLPCKTLTVVGEEMTWPSCNESVAEIGYRLRYTPGKMSISECLIAASIVDAYLQMVRDPQRKRNAVCKALREATPPHPTNSAS